MSTGRRIDAAEAARMIRKALVRKFGKSTKFYVTTSRYSGGASVDIKWMDGPTTKEVDEVVKPYSGKGFDGMIDMDYYKDAWLMPDGTVTYAKSDGTGASGGSDAPYSYPPPGPRAELVYFGCGYVPTARSESRALVEAVVEAVCKRTGWDKPEIVDGTTWMAKSSPSVPCAYVDLDYVNDVSRSDTFRRACWAMSAKDGITAEAAVEAVNAVLGTPIIIETAEKEPEPVAADRFTWDEGDIVILGARGKREESAPVPVTKNTGKSAPKSTGNKGSAKFGAGKRA